MVHVCTRFFIGKIIFSARDCDMDLFCTYHIVKDIRFIDTRLPSFLPHRVLVLIFLLTWIRRSRLLSFQSVPSAVSPEIKFFSPLFFQFFQAFSASAGSVQTVSLDIISRGFAPSSDSPYIHLLRKLIRAQSGMNFIALDVPRILFFFQNRPLPHRISSPCSFNDTGSRTIHLSSLTKKKYRQKSSNGISDLSPVVPSSGFPRTFIFAHQLFNCLQIRHAKFRCSPWMFPGILSFSSLPIFRSYRDNSRATPPADTGAYNSYIIHNLSCCRSPDVFPAFFFCLLLLNE